MEKYCILNSITRECVDIQYSDDPEQIQVSEGLEVMPEYNSTNGEVGMFYSDTGWKTSEEWSGFQRSVRDKLLETTVDRINPILWDSMSNEQKNSWINYRQLLLDVPQQSDFPRTVIWPETP